MRKGRIHCFVFGCVGAAGLSLQFFIEKRARYSVFVTSLLGNVTKQEEGVSHLEQVVRETTSILYKKSTKLQEWLSAPLPKVYVYDNLPKNWSDVATISQCVDDTFGLTPNRFQPHFNWTGCFWKPRVCDNVPDAANIPPKPRILLGYKANYNNDVAYLEWFEGYPHRTTNASEADLFLVPYPHKSHCLCRKDFTKQGTQCTHSLAEIEENVLSKLTFYPENRERHLFLFGVDWSQVTSQFAHQSSMSISLGPVKACKGLMKKLCGHQVTPYMSVEAAHQPDAIAALPEEWWISRSRSFSVAAAMSTPRALRMRVELMRNKSIHIGDSVGGFPVIITDLHASRQPPTPKQILKIYKDSIFCPILPGDGPPQKRFFDAILSGCIPVVPIFTPSDEEGYPTFWQWSGRPSIRQSYPFAKGSFFADENVGIDYMALVVTFDGFCGIPCMKPAMEEVMRNATELKRLRSNLREYARLFTFGLGENMYKSVDSFSAMLVAIRHYLFNLEKRQE